LKDFFFLSFCDKIETVSATFAGRLATKMNEQQKWLLMSQQMIPYRIRGGIKRMDKSFAQVLKASKGGYVPCAISYK
jgi:hypothetical protein